MYHARVPLPSRKGKPRLRCSRQSSKRLATSRAGKSSWVCKTLELWRPTGTSNRQRTAQASGDELAEQIDPGQIDDFVAASAENCFEHEEAESGHLLEGNRRRHRELLPADEDLDQGRSVMLESLSNHRSNLIRCLGGQPEQTCGFGHLRKIRVVKVGCEIKEAGCLHLQFDEGERVVSENNHFNRQLQLP